MRRFVRRAKTVGGLLALALSATAAPPPSPPRDLAVSDGEVGVAGGRLVVALRSEPKTLNPLVATDGASRKVLALLMGDLLHIDRARQEIRPALARSWKVSPDGRTYTLQLRRGIAFSDGHPLTADDVVFSFHLYLDPAVGAPQRDLLIVGGKPIEVEKVDPTTVRFHLAEPYAAAERLFDGFYVLPRHLLEKTYAAGRITEAWGLDVAAAAIAGLGPFRLAEHRPGERLVLSRNPHYWKVDRQGRRLPYLDGVVFLVVASEDAQVVRFQAGETDVLSRLSAANYDVLEAAEGRGDRRLYDLGPGLEYLLLFFNLNDLGAEAPADLRHRQGWFRKVAFRQAVSSAIDRPGIVRLAYRGRATPLWGHVTAGNRRWVDRDLPHPPRSLDHARDLLRGAGFSWREDGSLVDGDGVPVALSILTTAANAQRVQVAALLQADLGELGMRVQVTAVDSRSVLSRVLDTHDYEACLLGLGGGDADPNGEMNVWLSSGATHLWHLGEAEPATPWEAEIDRLMRRQLVTRDPVERRKLYDRVQELVARYLPVIPLAAPSILVGAKRDLGNFRPALLEPHALWNAEELFFRPRPSAPP